MIDIATISSNLQPGPDGAWVSRSHTDISYPKEGNEHCLELEEGSFWFEHRNNCIRTVVRRFAPGGTLFDIGGGNGYVAQGLVQDGIPVALLEPGWQGIQNARQRGITTLIWSTLEDAGFYPATLPAVGMFDVLEHISGDVGFLKNIHTLLVPGGRLFLTVPAFRLLWSVDDDYAGHQRRYTLGELRQRLESSGFQVDFASYIFSMLPLPIFFFRSIPARLKLRKDPDWQRYQREHQGLPGRAGGILGRWLRYELACLEKGRSLPLGGSCLVVGRKNLP